MKNNKKVGIKIRQFIIVLIAIYIIYTLVICPFLLFKLQKDNSTLKKEVINLKFDLEETKKNNNISKLNIFAKVKNSKRNKEIKKLKINSEINIRALIDTIALSEGGSWHICYGGIKANYSLPYPCPRRKIGKYVSSAYGSFQVLDTTWQAFSPKECKKITKENAQKCQIKVFKKILENRKIINDINKGNISAVMPVLGKEWASIEGNPYGQNAKFTKKEFLMKFKEKKLFYKKKYY